MCLQQLISASPKQGGAVDPQHRQVRGLGAAAVLTTCRQRLPQTCGVVLCQGLFKEQLCGEKLCGLGCRSQSPVARP